MEQSIVAGYTSGECIMIYMKQKLHKRDAKSICYNSIITQGNFHNSIHLDKKSIFSEKSKKKVMDNIIFDHRKKNIHANHYLVIFCNIHITPFRKILLAVGD